MADLPTRVSLLLTAMSFLCMCRPSSSHNNDATSPPDVPTATAASIATATATDSTSTSTPASTASSTDTIVDPDAVLNAVPLVPFAPGAGRPHVDLDAHRIVVPMTDVP